MNTMTINGHQAVISFDPDIQMLRGEFVGLNGGYVTSDAALIRFLRESSMMYIYSNPITVGEAGETTVTLRFLEVKLNVSIDVVHKHGIGSCAGKLTATPAGLRYQTTNKGDAFELGFGGLETFEVDYLKKNLRVKKRGGKTWNFTDKADNADNLFVFHRDVTKAREKLAAQKQ